MTLPSHIWVSVGEHAAFSSIDLINEGPHIGTYTHLKRLEIEGPYTDDLNQPLLIERLVSKRTAHCLSQIQIVLFAGIWCVAFKNTG